MTINYFVYKLLPPRPTFPADMSAEESAIMRQHAGYWDGLLTQGRVVVFGPVADPAGVWGLAVVEAESDEDVRALGAEDPAVKSGMTTFDVYPMPVATARPWRP
ncbi:MAG: YciI family protein [Dehalococcoidia bacterium]